MKGTFSLLPREYEASSGSRPQLTQASTHSRHSIHPATINKMLNTRLLVWLVFVSISLPSLPCYQANGDTRVTRFQIENASAEVTPVGSNEVKPETANQAHVPVQPHYSSPRIYAQPVPKSGTPQWRDAAAKWELFAEEHMTRMHKLDRSFDREWFEIKHPLISKYLSDYRVYTDKYFTFALSKSGHITVIGKTWPGKTPYKTAPDFEAKDFPNFFVGLALPVSTAENAIELVRLKLIVDGGHGFPSAYDDDRYWQFHALREKVTWNVRVNYTGDSKASIDLPPKWEIRIDKRNLFQGLEEK